jgi:hypothetical protein
MRYCGEVHENAAMNIRAGERQTDKAPCRMVRTGPRNTLTEMGRAGEGNGCTRTCGQELDAWEKGKWISIYGARCDGGSGKENGPLAGMGAEEICGHDWKLESRMKGYDLKLTWDAVVAGN